MRVFLIAGEASGDKLGAALMAGLKALRPEVTFDGVGGPLMQAEGMVSRFPMDELSVMGLAEILPKYRALKARIRQMADAIVDTRPDILITIDSPDFCLRVARLVKAVSDIRTVHYVAPPPLGQGAGVVQKRWPAILIMCWRCFHLSRPICRRRGWIAILSAIPWWLSRWRVMRRLLPLRCLGRW